MTYRHESAAPLAVYYSPLNIHVSVGLTAYQYTVIEMMKAIRSSASGSLGNGVPTDQVVAAAIKDADEVWDAFEKQDAVAPDESGG